MEPSKYQIGTPKEKFKYIYIYIGSSFQNGLKLLKKQQKFLVSVTFLFIGGFWQILHQMFVLMRLISWFYQIAILGQIDLNWVSWICNTYTI